MYPGPGTGPSGNKKRRRGTCIPRRHEPHHAVGRRLLAAAPRTAAARAAAGAAARRAGGLEATGRALADAAGTAAARAHARARLAAAAAIALRTTATAGGHEGHEAQSRPKQETVHGETPRKGHRWQRPGAENVFPATWTGIWSGPCPVAGAVGSRHRCGNRIGHPGSRTVNGGAGRRVIPSAHARPAQGKPAGDGGTPRGGRFSSARRRRESAADGSERPASSPGIPG
jgi:hypothetical protein